MPCTLLLKEKYFMVSTLLRPEGLGSEYNREGESWKKLEHASEMQWGATVVMKKPTPEVTKISVCCSPCVGGK